MKNSNATAYFNFLYRAIEFGIVGNGFVSAGFGTIISLGLYRAIEFGIVGNFLLAWVLLYKCADVALYRAIEFGIVGNVSGTMITGVSGTMMLYRAIEFGIVGNPANALNARFPATNIGFTEPLSSE